MTLADLMEAIRELEALTPPAALKYRMTIHPKRWERILAGEDPNYRLLDGDMLQLIADDGRIIATEHLSLGYIDKDGNFVEIDEQTP